MHMFGEMYIQEQSKSKIVHLKNKQENYLN